MKKSGNGSLLATSEVALCTILLVWLVLPPQAAIAQAPPPPPPDTPTATPTATYTATPSATATDTATPTNTATPTQTATSTHTTTPTNTSTATYTAAPVNTHPPDQPDPTSTEATRHPKKTPGAGPDPDCQSLVEGYVIDAEGQHTPGATVIIDGADWTNRLMTDDNGHYGFGGLCAGPATLRATLPNGQVTQAFAVTLQGKDTVHLDLGLAAAATIVPTGTAIARQATPTAVPNMPNTGYSGWMLAGGVFMGLVLLLVTGVRRAFATQERTGD
jgi:cytoskeletal protein RodZ